MTTAASAGAALLAAPFVETPAGVAVMGLAGIGAQAGLSTTITGYALQDIAGLGLAAVGDTDPILDTSFSVLNSIGLSVTRNDPPKITPVNPFSSAVNNMDKQISLCGH